MTKTRRRRLIRRIAPWLTSAVLICLACRDSSQQPGPGTLRHEFLGEGEYLGEYWPTDGWRECRPEEVGMNSAALLLVHAYAADPEFNTEGLVIVKEGYIVGEGYFRDFSIDDRHYSYSVAKSFTSAVVGMAIDNGFITGIDEKVFQYYPQWQLPNTDPRKQQITIRHLLTMMSGIEWNEDDYYSDPSQNDAFIMHRRSDMNQYVLDKPMKDTPGEVWYYSTGNSQLLSGVVQGATDQTVYEYARPNLLEPLGIEEIGWDHDATGQTHTGSGVRATVREFAKFGYLYLNKGRWDKVQIVSAQWVNESVQPISNDLSHYGYHWWLKPVLSEHQNSIVPDSTFIAWGIYTQQIIVIPEERMVIVRVGNDPTTGRNDWSTTTFLTKVMESVIDR
ncbi:MAG: beta-lactamase family protein [candidate division Zixibacteria bacterium]|nr:beta-lactamase family protein [candidate division Zixibacteria bacterium]MDH3936245.1 beta-lactamase family protein [candidate division Zixibacteria bacterium]MDH4033187.1 beta-lactamase family protein [candidate division Zixibacteria bacterium]